MRYTQRAQSPGNATVIPSLPVAELDAELIALLKEFLIPHQGRANTHQ